jgi:hypothetical protein
MHHWHGNHANRRYRERWSILTDHKFDPFSDIGMTETGLMQLTPAGRRMEKAIKEYFAGRQEDEC